MLMRIRCTLVSFAFAPLVLAADSLPLHDDALLPHEPTQYWDESLSGGPPKDGIPSVDNPNWWSASEAADFLEPDDRVIGLHINGEARAYPQRILVWHEIVNDTVGGKAVAVTYCPLTGTAIGYDRGDTTFGVSGRLVNSNLIMYDRDSDTYWPQILAAGIRGPHTASGLHEIRVIWTTWERWLERHPDTIVLSTRTRYARNYRHDPYGSYTPVSGYYAPNAGRIFPVMHEDERYPPKQEIFGFRDRGQAVAVNRDRLREDGVIRHTVDGIAYLVVHDPGLDTGWVYAGDAGTVNAPSMDAIQFTADGPSHPELETLRSVNGFEAMWFAWYAFYPDTVVLE